MPNEKYKRLLNINANYDPVLDFRNKVVDMRRLQNKYNKKGGLEILYELIDSEHEVDKIIFGRINGHASNDQRVLDEKKGVAHTM